MSMSRKDFELLARTIRTMPEDFRHVVANYFATALVGHSATFDKARFLKACGVPE